jgi:uncharacterized protein
MAVWAIADLHLSFGVVNKEMNIFGAQWENYTDKIEKAWRGSITSDDLVLIAGDISWAKTSEEAIPDLNWIDRLPGTKVLIKGNHDYWWGSLAKLRTILPASCHLIQNDSYTWKDVGVAGARLWDIPGLSFDSAIEFKEQARVAKYLENRGGFENLKIYRRELDRLEMSLKAISPSTKIRIAMTHYPPIGLQFEETEASQLMEKYKVNICVFGHLHNIKPGLQLFGPHHGIEYALTACDYLPDFQPLKVVE